MASNKKPNVCVIGLGYVGLPLAVQAALKGYPITGIQRNVEKIKQINAGVSPIDEEFLTEHLPNVKINATNDPKVIKKADIVLICVPTPVDESHYPDLTPVKQAVQMVIDNFKKGQLIVMESTINPGVCEEVIAPMFEEAGYKTGKDYDLAHCPERINPGDPKWNVTNIPRVVGSTSNKGLKLALKFYEDVIDASITPMKSIREAEAVKVVENSFRDINIAFVNELAKSFDKMDIDVVDVIKGASTKPFAFMAHWPSCGVGGHCIPVDPYYLIERAKKAGFDHKFLKVAREVNNSMPHYTVKLLQNALNELQKSVNGSNIGILGLSYKANVADLRESPSFKIIAEIEKLKGKITTYDPYLKDESKVKSLNTLLKKVDTLVLVTDHSEFKDKLTGSELKKNGIKIVIDGKNCLDRKEIAKYGIIYKGIGH